MINSLVFSPPQLAGEALAVCFLLSSVSTSLGASKVEGGVQQIRPRIFVEKRHFWWKIRIKKDNVNKIKASVFVGLLKGPSARRGPNIRSQIETQQQKIHLHKRATTYSARIDQQKMDSGFHTHLSWLYLHLFCQSPRPCLPPHMPDVLRISE